MNIVEALKRVKNDIVNWTVEMLFSKMDKENPTGTGSFSLNRKDGSAVGECSFAEGSNNIASGGASHAEGDNTVASGALAHAEGNNTIATGFAAHAEGSQTKAVGFAHAEGQNTIASDIGSHAEGCDTIASGQSSHAEGYKTIASGLESHAGGWNAFAYGNCSEAVGKGMAILVTLTGEADTTNYTFGLEDESDLELIKAGELIKYGDETAKIITFDGENHSIVLNQTLSDENLSEAEGTIYTLVASGTGAHAEGDNTIATGEYGAHAEGANTEASGGASHAEGYATLAKGIYSHAEGYKTTALAYGHAEGFETQARLCGHAEGMDTFAIGECSHAGGNMVIAYEMFSEAMGAGGDFYIKITGVANATNYTISECDEDELIRIKVGKCVRCDNNFAQIINVDIASRSISFDVTLSDIDLTDKSIRVFELVASGEGSHAEGELTVANGRGSHTEGNGTVARSDYQHAQGCWNIEDATGEYAHIVGNGTDEGARSNAHTLDWDGNAWFAGDVYIGGTGQDDETATKLATVADIETAIGIAIGGSY